MGEKVVLSEMKYLCISTCNAKREVKSIYICLAYCKVVAAAAAEAMAVHNSGTINF